METEHYISSKEKQRCPFDKVTRWQTIALNPGDGEGGCKSAHSLSLQLLPFLSPCTVDLLGQQGHNSIHTSFSCFKGKMRSNRNEYCVFLFRTVWGKKPSQHMLSRLTDRPKEIKGFKKKCVQCFP